MSLGQRNQDPWDETGLHSTGVPGIRQSTFSERGVERECGMLFIDIIQGVEWTYHHRLNHL